MHLCLELLEVIASLPVPEVHASTVPYMNGGKGGREGEGREKGGREGEREGEGREKGGKREGEGREEEGREGGGREKD